MSSPFVIPVPCAPSPPAPIPDLGVDLGQEGSRRKSQAPAPPRAAALPTLSGTTQSWDSAWW